MTMILQWCGDGTFTHKDHMKGQKFKWNWHPEGELHYLSSILQLRQVAEKAREVVQLPFLMPTLVWAFATMRGVAVHTQKTSRQTSIMETTASFTLSTRPSVCGLQGILPSVSFGSTTHCPSSSFHTSRVVPRRPSVRRVSQWFCNKERCGRYTFHALL